MVWGAGGMEAQEGGDICILIADLQLPNGQLKLGNKSTLQHCNKNIIIKTMIVLDFKKKFKSIKMLYLIERISLLIRKCQAPQLSTLLKIRHPPKDIMKKVKNST